MKCSQSSFNFLDLAPSHTPLPKALVLCMETSPHHGNAPAFSRVNKEQSLCHPQVSHCFCHPEERGLLRQSFIIYPIAGTSIVQAVLIYSSCCHRVLNAGVTGVQYHAWQFRAPFLSLPPLTFVFETMSCVDQGGSKLLIILCLTSQYCFG